MKNFMKLLLLACGLLIASCSNDEDFQFQYSKGHFLC